MGSRASISSCGQGRSFLNGFLSSLRGPDVPSIRSGPKPASGAQDPEADPGTGGPAGLAAEQPGTFPGP